jgi:gliding motility-associated-like protein
MPLPVRTLFAVIAVAALSVALTGCRKEEVKSIEPALGEAFLFCEDSCFVSVPNVFTPDGDGMNEVFMFVGRHFTLSEFTVYDMEGTIVFTTDSPNKAWDGRYSIPNAPAPLAGRYMYHLVGVTTTGTVLNGYRPIQLVTDHYSPCFNDCVAPVYGDQFDPRGCGVVYTSNDLICLM